MFCNKSLSFQEAAKLLFGVNILQLQSGFTPFTLHSFLEGGYLRYYEAYSLALLKARNPAKPKPAIKTTDRMMVIQGGDVGAG